MLKRVIVRLTYSAVYPALEEKETFILHVEGLWSFFINVLSNVALFPSHKTA